MQLTCHPLASMSKPYYSLIDGTHGKKPGDFSESAVFSFQIHIYLLQKERKKEIIDTT